MAMRTHVEEESWWVEKRGPETMLRSSSGSAATFGGRLEPDADRQRAELAAQAPSMARLLLRLYARSGGCVWCSHAAPDHRHDCELSTILRRAGVVR